mgnify:CR=1 FL=1
MAGCDAVIACVQHACLQPPPGSMGVNVRGGTRNVCDAAGEVGCRRVVLRSTISTLASAPQVRSSRHPRTPHGNS